MKKVRIAHTLLLVLLVQCSVWAQFSAGPLSTAHAQLEGMKNCTQCHELGEAISEAKCLDCHKEIKSLRERGRGFHNNKEVRAKSCVSCHSEHHGRNFNAMRLETKNFDHKRAGYELKGAHKKEECTACHKPEFIANKEIASRKGTYLGLQTACLSCHKDEHRKQLSKDCLTCHGMEEWTPVVEFSHQKSKFPLKGAHKEVRCEECHKKVNDSKGAFTKYVGVAHSLCTHCHKDRHEGRLGANCTACHNHFSWKDVNASGTFNHDKTKYPLIGKHKEVACKECHKKGNEQLSFARCTDCHKDYHEGDFSLPKGGVMDCNECHSTMENFSWTSYGMDDHQKSSYPLEGAHMATPCTACHQQTPAQNWEFSFASNECVSCHKNVHEGKLAEKFTQNNGCAKCHNTQAWSGVTFDHNTTKWPLEGLHTDVKCANCHLSKGIDSQKFVGLNQECMECHKDPHGGQFIVPNQTPQNNCAACHSTDKAWNLILFNHNASRFPLEGKHLEAKCSACHKEKILNGESVTWYKTNQLKCIDCHNT